MRGRTVYGISCLIFSYAYYYQQLLLTYLYMFQLYRQVTEMILSFKFTLEIY